MSERFNGVNITKFVYSFPNEYFMFYYLEIQYV